MRLRILLCVIGIAGFFISNAVQALGLGEITIKSQLNEPLNAEIRLLKLDDLSKEEVLVFLASRDDFGRAGIDRVFFLNDLRFDVFVGNLAYPYIRVTSSKPVTEPYLNFLVDVQWPSGRLVREYTVLLDLPTFSEQAAPKQVQAPVSSSLNSQPPSRPEPPASRPVSQPSSVSPPQQQPVAAVDRSVSADSYRVEKGDTLWEIAARSRPSGAVSVNQTMLAIQRVNPDAFSANNINLLQSGRVLRIPSESEINQINDNIATKEVTAQNRVWSNEQSATAPAALTSSSNTSSDSSQPLQPSGRLTLGSADSNSNAAQGSGNSASGTALQNDLAVAQEELDRSSRENGELKSRISELEAQIQTMEQLISVSNDQLRALELSLDNQKEPIDDQVSSVVDNTLLDEVTDELVVDDTQAIVDDPLNSESTVDELVVDNVSPVIDDVLEEPLVDVLEESPVLEEPQIVSSPVVDDVAPAAGSGLVNIIKEKWQLIAAGLGGLLLVILLALKMRQSRNTDDDDAFIYEEGNDFLDENVESEDDLVSMEPIESVDEVLDVDDVEAETEDVIAEADIYVSLGQEDKAVELLQKEIQQNPGNAEARLGLLGIYATAQNSEAFDDQYAQLLPLGNNYAIDQAKELRKQMTDTAPFDEENYSLDESDSSIDDLAELDLSNEPVDDLVEPELEPVEELDLDLDLSLDGDNSTVADDSDIEDFAELDDLDLDLDLNLEDDELLENASADALDIADASELNDDVSGLDLELDLELDTSSDELLDEIAEAADVGDEGLASDLDDAIDELDDLDLDLDLDGLVDDADEGVVEFDLDVGADELAFDESVETDSLAESLDQAATAMDSSLDDDLLAVENNNLDELSLDNDLDEDLDALNGEASAVLVDEEALDALGSEETLETNELLSQEDELPSDMDFEASTGAEVLEVIDDENKLSFDEPIDLDIDGLDQEIDAMTAELDDTELDEVEESISNESLDEAIEREVTDVVLSEDEDLSFLDETDEVATKLDLAKAYLDMGDNEGAQDILEEVLSEGNESQIDEAKVLMKDI